LLIRACGDASILTESEAFKAGKTTQPIIPCLFVTIACGILSGFHATQAPIIARTMKSERQARSSFYGMMVLEGIIAMVWAGAALAIYNKVPALMAENPNLVLAKITEDFLGSWLGKTTVVAVVVLAITSGDTAMRSMRLTLAEMMKIDQKPISKRLAISAPIIASICVLLWWSNQSAKSFGVGFHLGDCIARCCY
jgi:carbon starvation protein CstA